MGLPGQGGGYTGFWGCLSGGVGGVLAPGGLSGGRGVGNALAPGPPPTPSGGEAAHWLLGGRLEGEGKAVHWGIVWHLLKKAMAKGAVSGRCLSQQAVAPYPGPHSGRLSAPGQPLSTSPSPVPTPPSLPLAPSGLLLLRGPSLHHRPWPAAGEAADAQQAALGEPSESPRDTRVGEEGAGATATVPAGAAERGVGEVGRHDPAGGPGHHRPPD